MADNDEVSNSYLSNLANLFVRSTKRLHNLILRSVQHVRIDIGIDGEGNESLLSSSNPLPVSNTASGYSSVTEGQKDVTLVATPEVLGSQACKKVIIVGKETNTGTVWVKSTVTNNTLGRPLLALQSEIFYVTNLNLLFLKTTVAGEGITFLAFN